MLGIRVTSVPLAYTVTDFSFLNSTSDASHHRRPRVKTAENVRSTTVTASTL